MAEQEFVKAEEIDVLEESILHCVPSILRLLLQDKTTKKNILWATKDYESLGKGYEEWSEILPELITGEKAKLIQPRSSKAKEDQTARTRDKAEVFTPCWVCNAQNNLVDTQWFGAKDVFNVETETGWTVNKNRILFDETGPKTWKKYVDLKRLEVTCGEAPYLISRYDTVTGDLIPVNERIGILDRKLRVVSENTQDENEWFAWAVRAIQSVYGYEYQGDSLLLARENLLASFIEYYQNCFNKSPSQKQLRIVTNIASWNLWQMDGLKYVVPNSCRTEKQEVISVFGNQIREIQCPGCEKGANDKHNGIYCRIYDWRSKQSLTFVSMLKGAWS